MKTSKSSEPISSRAAPAGNPDRSPVEVGGETYLQLQQALEAADIGIWDWDLESDRVVMSDNMQKLLEIGRDRAGIDYPRFLQAIHPADRAQLAASLERAIRRRGAFDEEFRIEKRDQTIHWMRIRGRVSIGADGRPDRVMGSIHDKTERRLAYDALESARNELEAKVKERTRELLDTNERLRREIGIKNDLQKQIMEISEKEHRRIGQDLHDSLSQQLGGILFMSQVLKQKLEAVAPGEAGDLGKLITHLQNALTYTRDLARGLYPTLGEGGLGAALNELGAAVGQLFGITVTVERERGVNTSEEGVTIHLYRIVQEALNNAIRHGKATRVDIRLFRKREGVALTVTDNGVGFPEKPNRKGLGLNIMKYRASSIGASFEIESRRNRGSVVRCLFGKSGAFAKPRPGLRPARSTAPRRRTAGKTTGKARGKG